jgi:hypothetical protein
MYHEARGQMKQSTVERHTLTLQEVCDVLRITRCTAIGLIVRSERAAFKVGQAWRGKHA